MASEPKTIEVEPGGELDRLLDEARRTPLRLVRGGDSFRVLREGELEEPVDSPLSPEHGTPAIADVRESVAARSRRGDEHDDIWANYDPEVAIEGIRKAAGTWQGLVDAEAFKAYVRERRRTKNRPPVRR